MPNLLTPNSQVGFPLALKWCVKGEHPISQPIYENGLVFTLDGKQPEVTITAFGSTKGEYIWSAKSYNSDGAAGLPGFWTIDRGFMVIGTSRSVMVLNSQSGEILWEREPSSRGFALEKEKTIFLGGSEFIQAFDLETGEKLWEIAGQGRGWSQAPLYDALNNLLVLNEATYRLINPETGQVIFETQRLPREDQFNYNNNGGQIHNGLLFYMDEIINTKNGEVIHKRTIPAFSQTWEPAIVQNLMLVSDYDQVIAFDVEKYIETWRYETPEINGQQLIVVGDPIGLDGIVYIILSDASIRALDLHTGEEIGKWQGKKVVDQRGRQTPIIPGFAVGDGMLFASFGTNELCAFGKP